MHPAKILEPDRKCCLFCQNYALWDGDYVCIAEFKILSYASINDAAETPEEILKERKCNNFNTSAPKGLQTDIEVWNCLNAKHKVKLQK